MSLLRMVASLSNYVFHSNESRFTIILSFVSGTMCVGERSSSKRRDYRKRMYFLLEFALEESVAINLRTWGSEMWH